jgi:hypothetical protein
MNDSLAESEAKLWERIRAELGQQGPPLAVSSTITPFPFWGIVVALVVFIPIALILSFFVRRQAVLVQAGRLRVIELSFWRFRVTGEPVDLPLAPGAAVLDRKALLIDGRRYHTQPGWGGSAERIVALCEAA